MGVYNLNIPLPDLSRTLVRRGLDKIIKKHQL